MACKKRQTYTRVCALAAAVSVLMLSGCEMTEGQKTGFALLVPKLEEFIPALIAFLIIWLVIAKLAWPSIAKMMDQRQQKIQNDLDAAESAKLDAEREKQHMQEELDSAAAEADAIVAKAKKEAEAQRSQILADAQHEATEIISKAHDAVDSERKKAMIELSGQVVDLSVEIAGKIIGNELSEEQQRHLAEKYLAEVGKSDEL